jgi:fumarate hydratase class I
MSGSYGSRACRETEGTNAFDACCPGRNMKLAETVSPICQDTGVPTFWVKIPIGLSHFEMKNTILEATRLATEKVPLRPNAVDSITDKNSGDNTGIGFPVIYMEETRESSLTIDLMLKGAGCENVGEIYKLPDAELNAQRDLDGVRKCVLDTVQKAQGKACPPYILGVGIGATKDQVTKLAKEQLLRRLTDVNKIDELYTRKACPDEINELG